MPETREKMLLEYIQEHGIEAVPERWTKDDATTIIAIIIVIKITRYANQEDIERLVSVESTNNVLLDNSLVFRFSLGLCNAKYICKVDYKRLNKIYLLLQMSYFNNFDS